MTAETVLRDTDPETVSARAVWGSARPVARRWHIRARVRTIKGGVPAAHATNAAGVAPTVRWMREDGVTHRPLTVYEVVEAMEWVSPWDDAPTAPHLPGT